MVESVHIDLKHGNRSFSFDLLQRPIELGSAGPIRYHWMDSRLFRRRPPGPNFRSCVDLWWANVEMAGDALLLESQINLVLAECFPLVSTAHSLQDVYLDAHLHRSADREVETALDGRPLGPSQRTYTLPPEESDRLSELAHRRDSTLVRAEFERLFLGSQPPETEMLAYQRAFCAWVGSGCAALREGGRDGLRQWIHGELHDWLKKLRKRGGQDRIRLFVNMFSYECKVSFYLCYANAWLRLIPWLVANQGLDPLSERFLRFWHYQNQPIEDPAAPTGGHRDALCGQVLALHPLAGVVLSAPNHLQVIGDWFGHPDFEQIVRQRQDGSCAAYWEMVATLLVAAHEYQRSHKRWDENRGEREAVAKLHDRERTRDDAEPAVSLALEDYVQAHGHLCSSCGSPLAYARREFATDGGREAMVIFRCRDAGHENRIAIKAADLRDYLQAE